MTSSSLFASVREAAETAIWSRGIEHVRGERVSIAEQNANNIDVRVLEPGRPIARHVVLYPKTNDWECNCMDGDDPCQHVTAAAIFIKQNPNATVSTAPTRASVAYKFISKQGALTLTRHLAWKNNTAPLQGSVVGTSPEGMPPIDATDLDVRIEGLLIQNRNAGSVLAGAQLRTLLSLLIQHPRVFLDGESVQVIEPVAGVRVHLARIPSGMRLYAEQDPSIRRVFDGAALTPKGFCSINTPPPGIDVGALKRGMVFSDNDMPMLVGELLPKIQTWCPIEHHDVMLPTLMQGLKPRIHIDDEKAQNGVVVLPTIVYGDPPIARIDGEHLHLVGNIVPVRDKTAERILAERLQRQTGLKPGYKQRLTIQETIALVDGWHDFDPSERHTLSGDLTHTFFMAGDLQPGFDQHGINFSTNKNGHANPSDVLQAWRSNEPLVKLLDGGFAKIPQAWLDAHGSALLDIFEASDANPTLCALVKASMASEFSDRVPEIPTALRDLMQDPAELPLPPIPEATIQALRHYQQDGVRWLYARGNHGLGALLADDMGLGKTLQALCAAQGRTLVVCPTSVLSAWLNECTRFRPDFQGHIYHGAKRELDERYDVMITSYGLLRRDLDQISAIAWDTIILDEAQTIKNPESQVAQAAYQLRAQRRIALTGTPIENHLDDLWSQFQFLNPGLLGGRNDFRTRTIQPMQAGDLRAQNRLRARVMPLLLRRKKVEVAKELPSRTVVTLQCTLSQNERQLYDAVYAATVPGVLAQLQEGQGAINALTALMRLRQACCHTGLLPGQHAETSSKIIVLLEQLTTLTEAGHKALVFSQWTGFLDLIESHLVNANINFLRIDGSTNNRGEVVEAFQRDDGPPVMLISLKAGGTGLTLTAADHVFILDPWWNPAVEDQAADRAHRIGQTKPVLIQRLVAENTVEERILALQDKKRALASSLLDGEPGGVDLTRDEMMQLFQD